MVCSSCGSNEAMYCARCFHSSSGRTAENTVGTQPTDVQRLKAEIATAIAQLDFCKRGHLITATGVFVERMRQLSAV